METLLQNKKSIIRNNTSRLIENCDISQKDIARAVGVTPSSVSRWKKGLDVPKLKYREKLAKILGVSVDQFTKDNPGPTASNSIQDFHIRKIVKEVVAEDSRLKLIERYLEKVIGILEPVKGGEKEKRN